MVMRLCNSYLKQAKASEMVSTSGSGSPADQAEIEKLEEQAFALRKVFPHELNF